MFCAASYITMLAAVIKTGGLTEKRVTAMFLNHRTSRVTTSSPHQAKQSQLFLKKRSRHQGFFITRFIPMNSWCAHLLRGAWALKQHQHHTLTDWVKTAANFSSELMESDEHRSTTSVYICPLDLLLWPFFLTTCSNPSMAQRLGSFQQSLQTEFCRK